MLEYYKKNFSKILQGNIIGQVIAYLTLPIAAYYFTPVDFALSQRLISIASILSVMSFLRLEVAFFYCKSKKQSLELLNICFWVLLTFSIFVSSSLFIFSILTNFDNSFNKLSIIAIPILLIAISLTQLFGYIAVLNENYSQLSNNKIIQAASTSVSMYIFGTLNLNSLGLIISECLGRFISGYYLIRIFNIRISQIRWPGLKKILFKLKSEYETVTFGLLAAIFSSITSFTTIIITFIFTLNQAGHFIFIERLIGMPLAYFSTLISQIFMGYLSSNLRLKNYKMLLFGYKKFVLSLFIVSFVLIFITFMSAPIIVKSFFGEKWLNSLDILNPLLFLYSFSFVFTSVNMALTVLNLQVTQFKWDFFRFLVICFVWAFAYFFHINITNALWVYAITSSSFYLFYLFIVNQKLYHISRK
jgi:O-antigen/teichoic acid export membrane protein